MSIRRFQPDDQVAVQHLILSGLAERWGWLDPGKNRDLDDIAESYAEAAFLVAWLAEERVGTGALIHEADGVARIVRMSVLKHRRGQGIGHLLCRCLCDCARARGYSRVILETTDTWHDAIHFYERCGFHPVGSWGGDTHFALDL